MPTEQTMQNLIINNVESQEVYNSMLANGQVNENELYLVKGNDNTEKVTNKATLISMASTDAQYPSAKAVYDLFNGTRNIASVVDESLILGKHGMVNGEVLNL